MDICHISLMKDWFPKGPDQPEYCREDPCVRAAPLVADGGVAVRLAVASRWRQGNIPKSLVAAWQSWADAGSALNWLCTGPMLWRRGLSPAAFTLQFQTDLSVGGVVSYCTHFTDGA